MCVLHVNFGESDHSSVVSILNSLKAHLVPLCRRRPVSGARGEAESALKVQGVIQTRKYKQVELLRPQEALKYSCTLSAAEIT